MDYCTKDIVTSVKEQEEAATGFWIHSGLMRQPCSVEEI